MRAQLVRVGVIGLGLGLGLGLGVGVGVGVGLGVGMRAHEAIEMSSSEMTPHVASTCSGWSADNRAEPQP